MNKSRSLSSDNILDAESQYHSPADQPTCLSNTTLLVSETDSKRTRLKKSMSSDQILRGPQLCSNKSKECKVAEDWSVAAVSGFNEDFNNCANNSESDLPELVTVQKHSLGEEAIIKTVYTGCPKIMSLLLIIDNTSTTIQKNMVIIFGISCSRKTANDPF